MSTESNPIHEAEFNPRIKSYLFWYISLIMVITIIGIPVFVLWTLGIGQFICRRYYENLKCQLTETHLEFKKGAWFKIEKTIPLENIQDITFIDNPLLRIFDLRILKIETAGQSVTAGGDMELIGIIETYAFKQKVLKQREMLVQKKNTYTAETASPAPDKSIELLKEIRDILNDIKNKK